MFKFMLYDIKKFLIANIPLNKNINFKLLKYKEEEKKKEAVL